MARVVIALGGNTLLGEQGRGTFGEQVEAIEATATEIVAAIDAGHDVIVTHGNGPQIGTLLLQQESAPETPQLPLDVLVAETQAQIGYLLQRALDNELTGSQDYLSLVTQVVVDADDPAFEAPSKPIGPFYSAEEAAEKPFPTRDVGVGDRAHRRVVPSPDPKAIVEAEEIASMVDRGNLVICCGGGGVPVVRREGYEGVEAVVDKDLTSQIIASTIDADALVILTDVEYAYRDYGTESQQPIETVTPGDLEPLVTEDQFGVGSMRPKIQAGKRFVRAGGELAVITTPNKLIEGIAGEAGTRIVSG